ncbi:MAG: hypothetical protein EAZ97_11195 [Bacteroidetes bacterium]|nr:MAG: hypothetical protein EAZ97_11195 [Bacteroidota bacterium]
MQMSKQINVYLTQEYIEKTQKYLLARNFMLIKDDLSELPQPTYLDYLLQYPLSATYLSFPEAILDYNEFQIDGTQKYRLKGIRAEVITFHVFGIQDDLFRVRFYYRPYYFENQEKKFKNSDFSLQVDRFFRWLRAQFKPVPDMPTFYYNPDFAPKEWF